MLPDIDSTFFHVLCGNLIVSKGSLYVYLFELNLRNLLYVIWKNVNKSSLHLNIVQQKKRVPDGWRFEQAEPTAP